MFAICAETAQVGSAYTYALCAHGRVEMVVTLVHAGWVQSTYVVDATMEYFTFCGRSVHVLIT